ncbi:Zf-C2H2-3 domain-containing protein [Fusarium sp. LHS14.1]|nr:Zf-C2H2-3 domain-containing protein [Fusarium sp. LHS14.1]
MYADYSDTPWTPSNLTFFRTNNSAPSSLRMRAKPLRTYGKRGTTRENSPREPSPKKRRISTEATSLKKQNTKEDDEESPSLPKITAAGGKDSTKPTASDSKSPKDVVKKGSILNFFKPVSSSSSTVAPSPKSDEPQPQSTPPSSPPQPPRIETRRKPRILRFGGPSLPTVNNEETESDAQDDEEAEGNRKEGKGPTRSPLKEQHTTNTTATKPKKLKPQTVQTTLNISSQAPFSECKVCNTVWNPLYPDDVKYHTKQHAAVLRARKKESEAL